MQVYKWSAKGIKKVKAVDANQRFVFTEKKSAILYNVNTKQIIFLDLYKTKDSFIVLTEEAVPIDLWISENHSRMYAPVLLEAIKKQVPFEIIKGYLYA